MRRHKVAVGLVGLAVGLAACGSGGDLPKLPGQAAGASGERSMAAADSASMMVANIRYELAEGVATEATHGDAYDFANASRGEVERLAKAFGVTGTVHEESESWTVGGAVKDDAPRSSDEAYLHVTKNGGVFSMSVDQSGSSSGSAGCAVDPVAPAGPDAPVQSDAPACDAPTTTTTVPPDAPTRAEAERVAKEAMTAAGVPIRGARVSVESYDPATQNVRFQYVVDGTTVDGYEAYVTVGQKNRILSASGHLMEPRRVGSYELASLERAVERLNEQFQAGPYPARDTDGDATAAVATEPAYAPEDPALGRPEEPGSSEPTVVRLTAVRAGLMMQSDFDGDLWLVPAYLFSTEDKQPVTAQAAADKYIEQPPATTTEPRSDGGPPPADGGEPEPGTGDCVAIEGAITGQVCADRVAINAGESVRFTVTAVDEDRAFSTGPCFDGVTVSYGDDAGGDVSCQACSTEVAPGSGKTMVERVHTYDKAGTYTAKFTVKSGADCAPDPKDSQGEASLTIRVA